MFLAASGNVGIGVTTPTIGALQATGGAAFTNIPANTSAIGQINSTTGWVGQGFLFDGPTANSAFGLVYNGLNAYFGGVTNSTQVPWLIASSTGLSIGSGLPLNKLDVPGGTAIGAYASLNLAPSNGLIVSGNVGVATSTPGSLLSIGGVANFTAATSTFYGNGLNLSNGCYAVNGNCVGTNASSITSGTLSLANGGTGLSSYSGNQILYTNAAGTALLQTSTSTLNIGGTAANVTGTVAVANGGTGQTSFTSSNLLYGAGSGALQSVATSSINAGTGVTFSGTPGALVGGNSLTINTPWTISGANIFNNNSGYVGIGTTTPHWLLNLSTSTASQLTLGDGTNNNPWSFRSVGGNLYIGTSSPTSFATSSTPALSIVSTPGSQSGTIGIGSSTPWGKLSVEMGILSPAFVVSNSGSSSPAFYVAGVNGNGNVGVGTSSPGAAFSVQANQSQQIADFSTINGNSVMHITAGGNTGFASTSPWAQLSINPTAANGSAPSFVIGSSTATQFIVNNNGSVGVGTTSPALASGQPSAFAVTGYANFNNLRINGADTGNTITQTAGNLGLTTTGGTITLGTSNGASNLFIGTTGNVGVGTTTPQHALTVSSTANGQNLWIESNANNTGLMLNNTQTGGRQFELDSSGGSATIPSSFYINDIAGGVRFLINSVGNIGIGATTTPGSLLSIGGASNTTGINFSLATSTFTNVGGINLTTGCYAINGTCLSTSGGVTSLTAGSGITLSGSTGAVTVTNSIGYPFGLTGNATSSLTQFNGGLTAFASSTIGNGTGNGGLTISGNSTTTGNAYLAGKVGIATKSPIGLVQIGPGSNSSGVGTPDLYVNDATPTFEINDSSGGGDFFIQPNASGVAHTLIGTLNSSSLLFTTNNTIRLTVLASNGNIGIGTTSPLALLSTGGSAYIGGNLTATGTVQFSNYANGLLAADASGNLYSSASSSIFGFTPSPYPFPQAGNGTSTLTQFNGGLTAFSSSTIGNGTQQGGLTVNGGATTTGNAYIAGNVGIGTNPTTSALTITNANPTSLSGVGLYSGSSSAYTSYTLGRTSVDFTIGIAGNSNNWVAGTAPGDTAITTNVTGESLFLQVAGGTGKIDLNAAGGNVGVGTTTPGSLLSIGGSGTGINFSLATSTFTNVGGLNLTSGCYAVNGTCVGTNASSITSGTLGVANGGTGQTSFTSGNLLYGAASGALQSVATSSETLGLGLSFSGTLGARVGGTSGSLTIATSSLYSGTTGQFPYFSGTNTITATSSLFLAASGNVGIATTSPASTFEINTGANRDINFFSNGGYNYIALNAGLSPTTASGFASGNITDDSLYIDAGNSGSLIFRTSGTTQRATITSGGNLGVGATTTPGSLLSLGAANNTTGINFSLATTTFTNVGGINLTTGCYAVNGTCVGTSASSITSGTLPVANGGTGLSTFGGTNTVLFTTTANNLSSNTNFTFNGSTLTAPTVNVPVTGGYYIGGSLFAYASSTNADVVLGLNSGGNATTSALAASNVAIGDNVLSGNQGFNNIGIGNYDLTANTSGTQNIAIGWGALQTNTTGNFNIAIGTNALASSTGTNNDAFGYYALASSTTGNANDAFGSGTLLNNIGSRNNAFGFDTLNSNTTGTGNVGYGFESLFSVTTGNYNVGLGDSNNTNITTGSGNIMVGVDDTSNALANNITTGSDNIGVGYNVVFPSPTASNQLNIGNSIYGTLTATSSSTSLPTAALLAGVRIGIASTSPWAQLSVNPNGLANGAPAFAVGSSTATQFVITNAGLVGIGTTNPVDVLDEEFNLPDPNQNGKGLTIHNTNTGNTSAATIKLTNDAGNSVALQMTGQNWSLVPDQNSAFLTSFSTNLGLLSDSNVATGGTHTISFYTGGYTNAAAMTIVGGNPGRVGIGSTTPWGQLLASSTATFPALAVQQNGSGPAATFLGGNISIGSTTPGSLLSIGNTTSTTGINFSLATSTFTNVGGINLTTGCYAVNGTCLSTSGGTNFWTLTGNNISNNNNGGNGFVGIGTTTPWAQFSINPLATNGSAPSFAVGSSTSTKFVITNAGLVGIGTSTPSAGLTVYQSTGAAASSQGIVLTGNSIGGTNTGTGALISLGYNAPGNKQVWFGDPDYAGNSAGAFVRMAVVGGAATLDAITGNNGLRAELNLGDSGDPLSDVGVQSNLLVPQGLLAVGTSTANPSAVFSVEATSSVGFAQLVSVANNSNKMLFNVLSNGNVGIGTSTPGSLLSLNGATGSINLSTTATSTFSLAVKATCFTTDGVTCLTSGTGTNYWTLSGGNLFNNSGNNVGIGSSTPYAQLSVTPSLGEVALAVASSSGSTMFSINQYGEAFFGVQSASATAGNATANIFINGGGTTTPTFAANMNDVAIGNQAFSYYTNTALNNIAVGYQALYGSTTVLMTGDNNTALGNSALFGNTTGSDNTAVGSFALFKNATGSENVALGNDALEFNSGGNNNNAFGKNALTDNTFGNDNFAAGFNSLFNNATGSANFAVGNTALFHNTGGNNNVGIGTDALANNATGTDNLAIGFQAGGDLTGSYNLALGNEAMGSGSGQGTVAAGGGFNVALGVAALGNDATGTYNNAMGQYSLLSNLGGTSNDAFGAFTLQSNTYGNDNVAMGESTLQANTLGSYNVGIGYQVLKHSTTTVDDVAIGFQAMNNLSGGTDNNALGYKALQQGSGSFNNAFGNQALQNNTSGSYNNALGQDALLLNTTGSYNNALGIFAMFNNATGTDNNALGQGALYSNTGGNYNNALGNSTLYDNTIGTDNNALGHQALTFNTTGSFNNALGAQALYSNITGTGNNAFGNTALFANTGGSQNNAFGTGAMSNSTAGGNNNAFGNNALDNNIGDNNNAFGNSALAATAGTQNSGFDNNAIGFFALNGNTSGDYNNAIGPNTLQDNTTGSSNNAFGYGALNVGGTGSYNNAIGQNAMGNSPISGSYNNAIGDNAMANVSSGNYNTAIGYQALDSLTTGYDNIMLGDNANIGGTDISTGHNNILLGYDSDIGTSTSATNFLNIGNSFFGLLAATTTATTLPNTFPNVAFSIATSALNGSTFSVENSATGKNVASFFSATGAPLVTILNSGNVGIGTTTPADPLTVIGDGSTGDTMILQAGSNTGASSIDFQDSSGIQQAGFGYLSSGMSPASTFVIGTTHHDILFSTASFATPVMIIKTNGAVGIGTSSPSAELSVSTTTQNNGSLALFVVASTTNATLFNVLGNGNVGIGSSTPYHTSGYKCRERKHSSGKHPEQGD